MTRSFLLPLLFASGLGASPQGAPASRQEFDACQADVATIHQAIRAGCLTARRLVELSLERIAAHDEAGAGLRAILVLMPDALAAADAADLHWRKNGTLLGPLHGIPVVIKDNIDVAGTPTSLGLPQLQNALPPADAVVVARLRQAGAVLLAKTNLADLARSSRDTVSTLRGRTRNPYSKEHTIAGSSGGTAAAVAAGFATVGLGTDTGASIRAPCAHACLVGIRPTHGSVPMAGISPLYVARDTVGPIARTVADAALLLAVLRGEPQPTDIGDPAAVAGLTVGVLTFLARPDRTDPEVAAAFAQALVDLRALGVRTVEIGQLVDESDLVQIPVDRERFKSDLQAFLATRLPPYDRVLADDLVASRPAGSRPAGSRLESRARPLVDPAVRAAALRSRLAALAAEHRLAAFVHPTWSRAPRRLDAGPGDNSDNSGFVAPPAGCPALTVPMGFAEGALPLGLEIAGLPGTEAALIRIARAYEEATRHRRPPPLPAK